MKRTAVALVGLISLSIPFVEISAAELRGSRHFGRSKPSHVAGSLSQSRGFHSSFRGHGLHRKFGSRHFHRHRFGHHKHFLHKRVFVPHHHFGHHHVIVRRHGFHRGFFFGHRVISVGPSSVVIWSDPGMAAGFTVPRHQRTIDEEGVFEKPLITIMLRQRQELGLSKQQVQDLEELRDGYEREAIRYEADRRIAEMELQRILKAGTVDLEQVKVKLQEIEHLKAELRLARIRAIEQGKALLSPKQHEKLQALLGDSRYSQLGDERFSEPKEDQP